MSMSSDLPDTRMNPTPECPYALFDLDGTLVDSNPFWGSLVDRFLAGYGIKRIPDEVRAAILPMTVPQSSRFLIDRFHLPCTPEEAQRALSSLTAWSYGHDVPLKEGVGEYLRALRGLGTRMCVVSATNPDMVEACLTGHGIRGYFEFVVSCEQVGAGKESPAAYREALRRFGLGGAGGPDGTGGSGASSAPRPSQAMVYEDALYALRTAKNAGFHATGVFDAASAGLWPEIRRTADRTVGDWVQAARQLTGTVR